ncbi:hypothetical protein [Acinetobacter sp.]|uniref:hypothetical protein n=1 Tax=Acinetobacter sp. TaxID=472 RepID=UPI0031D28951
MKKTVVLIDLAYIPLSTAQFKQLFEQHSTVYIFHRQNDCKLALSDLTAVAEWIQQGRLQVLSLPVLEHAQQENTVLAGQLLAQLSPQQELLIVADEDTFLDIQQVLLACQIDCQRTELAKVATTSQRPELKAYKMPSPEAFLQNPQLLLIKRYCHALDKMEGKPTHLDALKNSLVNTLQIPLEATPALVGMLSNLKIIKCLDDQVSYRKKILKHWVNLQLELEPPVAMIQQMLQSVLPTFGEGDAAPQVVLTDLNGLMKVLQQKGTVINAVQPEVLEPICLKITQHLAELKQERPKNLFELRDMLVELFPEADVQILLKSLLDQGYIHWDGVRLIFSHELSLH